MKYYVCLGDRTTGGGVVIEGNIQTIILGRPVASMGMKAICCNRPQTILQGWAGHLDHGKQIAYDGCLLSCGHKVVASQNLMGWSDGNCSSDVPEEVMSKPQKHHEFFTLLDDENKPVVNQKYRLSADDGSIIEGYTNAQGQTDHLWTHEKLPVNFEVIDDEEETEFDNYHITDK
ncbi:MULTISPECIES: PAAR domain-containing protein [Acinetobacter]|jgi:uncharacterized Zn-binding protein involved in type VI secretion|uniref:PAAR domain-containing protein n=2 Tax=Moraxellaceae TaxID=468 RepID=UPI000DE77C11|nr:MULTISPECIES: PAAR domain-containing protein [Acinetobacter]MCH7352542.1 PAAR domain-containing protein [Acinetobacter sp. NIPH 2023]MCH7359935.1 PAAR domain-containing protein [Acinetobacter sp. NIPH 2024]MDA3584632.1 PAAR domain-containing protein [Acinetobacter baumannii]MDC4491422.1 PAAR domain-containing protein [Acinetobacter baumannii]MDC5130647.1 PAAR domain-containing protein [Acinetobacter baumannii]